VNAERILRGLGLLHDRDRLVKVRSWRPHLSVVKNWRGVEWPCFIVERGGIRMTIRPLWDWPRVRQILA
jgi:hypothetical protein